LDKTESIEGAIPEPTYDIPVLPPKFDYESKPILRELKEAHRWLALLDGKAEIIPNQGILIDSLALQEAAASSEIENIVTTQDELFRTDASRQIFPSAAAKEVALYSVALRHGFEDLQRRKGVLSNNCIIGMFQTLKRTTGEFRKTPGTVLKNERTKEIVFVPPQSYAEIIRHMSALEKFMNEDLPSEIDPLVAMAIIHHQFESIHPFPDGNGRLGRIINVLYLCRLGYLRIPILYISRYIVRNKSEYYRLLQSVRDTGNWEEWVIFIIKGVAETARETSTLVSEMKIHMDSFKETLRQETKIYSHELVNNLFRHPYTRIEYVMDEVGVSRPTAGRYLDQISEIGLLTKLQIGRNNYYVNQGLVDLLARDNT
jgi:Fic family protein